MANDIRNALISNQQPMKLEHERVDGTPQQLPGTSDGSVAKAQQDDRVTLTDTATKLNDLSRRLAAEPFEDMGAVERIKQQLADGSFRVDAAKVADGLIAHESLLGKEGS